MTQAIFSSASARYGPASDTSELPRPDLSEYQRAPSRVREPVNTTRRLAEWRGALDGLHDTVFAGHSDAIKAITEAFESIAQMRIVSAERTDHQAGHIGTVAHHVSSETLAHSINKSEIDQQEQLTNTSVHRAQYLRAEVVAGEFDYRCLTQAVMAADSGQLALLFMGKVAEQNPQAMRYFSLLSMHMTDGYRHEVFHAVLYDNHAAHRALSLPEAGGLESATLSASDFTTYLLGKTRACALIMPSLNDGKILTLSGLESCDALEIHMAMMFEQTSFMLLPLERVELLTDGPLAVP